MLYAHGPDLCRESDLRHAMANCFEALIGKKTVLWLWCILSFLFVSEDSVQILKRISYSFERNGQLIAPERP